jgi:hypothetical protein
MLTTKQIAAISRLHSKCRWPIGRIERHLQISRKTIKKYLLCQTRRRVHVCRSGKLDPFKAVVTELVQQDPSPATQSILQQLRRLGYKGEITILRNHLRNVRAALSRSSRWNGRQEAFEWMHRLLQGAIPEKEVHTYLGHVSELNKLLSVVTEERLSMRNKAVAVLARERGIAPSHICSFLFIDRKTAARYWNDYERGGSCQLFGRKPSGRQKSTDVRNKEAVFALLHSPPSMHGINRST